MGMTETLTPLSRQDKEKAEIRRWLDSLELPTSIVEYRLLLDTDWEGDPKVKIYFILSDDLDDAAFHVEALRIREMVMESFYQTEMKRWPFPAFRQKHEQDELDEEERRERERAERRQVKRRRA